MFRFTCGIVLLALNVSNTFASPLLHYTFDDQANPTADSGSGAAANGTLTNSPAFVTVTPGGTGYALSTGDGVNRFVTTATSPSKLSGLTALTMTTWVKLTGAPASGDRLLSNHNNSLSGKGYELQFWTPNSGSIAASDFSLVTQINGSGFNNRSTADVEFAAGTWLFIATTWDTTTEEVRFYVGTDTLAVTQLGSVKGNPSGVTTLNGSAAFEVGGSPEATADRTPPAIFDEVRVYGQSLALAELEQVRLATIPEPASLAVLGLASTILVCRRRCRR